MVNTSGYLNLEDLTIDCTPDLQTSPIIYSVDESCIFRIRIDMNDSFKR